MAKAWGSNDVQDNVPLPKHPSATILEAQGYDTENGGKRRTPRDRSSSSSSSSSSMNSPQNFNHNPPPHGVTTNSVLQGVYANRSALELVHGPAEKEGNVWNIDFNVSLDGVRLWRRYRDELPREAAWDATERALAAARDLERDEKVVVAVDLIDRHPVAAWLHGILEATNRVMRRRTLARNKLKKYSLDVVRVWHMNLRHLREHATFDDQSGLTSGGLTKAGAALKRQQTLAQGHRGLEGGRDAEAIAEGESAQIQSVSLSRALSGAYYSSEPPVEPKKAPAGHAAASLQAPPVPPPHLWELCASTPLLTSTNDDGYGGKRYFMTVTRLKRPFVDGARWCVEVYDRYTGGVRRHVMTEGEAVHLAEYMATLAIMESDEEDSDEDDDEDGSDSDEDSDLTPDEEEEEDDDDDGSERRARREKRAQKKAKKKAKKQQAGDDEEDSTYGRLSVEESLGTAVSLYSDESIMTGDDTEDAEEARREAVRNRAYERDFLGKHRRIAKSLLQLVEDPDREHADVKAKGDVLVKGIESVREIRAEEERARREAELSRRRKAEEDRLARNFALREQIAAAKELALMEAEEKAERERLRAAAAKEEWEAIKAATKDFFLMCDRTARNTIRRSNFVAVLFEEPEVAEGLRLWRCLPFQALPEQDREHEPNQVLSEELLGMVFDEIDAYGGFTSGEIPMDNMQKYILEKTGEFQLPGGAYGLEADYGSDSDDDTESRARKQKERGGGGGGGGGGGDGETTKGSKQEHSAEDLLSGADLDDEERLIKEAWAKDGPLEGGGGGWQEESDLPKSMHPLSIRCSEHTHRTRQVPGAVAMGRPGLWMKNPIQGEPERTSAAGMFFRDTQSIMCSVPTVLVNVLMALDTPNLAPALNAWEDTTYLGTASRDVPHAPQKPPLLMSVGEASRKRPPAGTYDSALAATCVVLSEAEVQADYGHHIPKGDEDNVKTNKELPPHRRFLKPVNKLRFRQVMSTEYTLYPFSPTRGWTFTVSGKGLLPNEGGFCRRHVWHSEQRCVEQLCRQRGAKDIYEYLDFTATITHHGANEPAVFLTHLDGG